MTARDLQLNGYLYPLDDELLQAHNNAKRITRLLNATLETERPRRSELAKELFAEAGDTPYIEPPFHANWGGHHVHFGKGVYANFNLTMVDDTHIYVGDYTMFGPNVTVATAGHPLNPSLRSKAYQYNMPVHIGKNCWLGAGA